MKPCAGPPADLMAFVWLTLFIVGTGLVADCAMHIFNWLAGHR